jgi:hypothetical protein
VAAEDVAVVVREENISKNINELFKVDVDELAAAKRRRMPISKM